MTPVAEPVQAEPAPAERLLDAALALGEARGSWEAVHLHDLADALDIPLAAVRTCYAQKDDLAEAWFDRADRAALQAREAEGFADLPVAARLERIILAWLDALEAHRRLTRGMLGYKLEPGHLHLQLPGLVRISRTVQWFLEAAQQDSTGLRRIVDESTLTLIYLGVFARWLYDDSPGAGSTRAWLARALQRRYARAGSAGTGQAAPPAGEVPREDADSTAVPETPTETTGSG